MESILTSIKKLLGITEEYTHFDNDLIILINTELAVLTQMGIGPAEGFSIEDKQAYWEDFIEDKLYFEPVKSFIHLRVKLIFDPPLSSTVVEAYKAKITELETRLYWAAETPALQGEEG